MRRIFLPAMLAFIGLAIGLCGATEPTLSCFGVPAKDLNVLATDAVSSDHATAEAAIQKLREEGPDGLHALLSVHAELIGQHTITANGLDLAYGGAGAAEKDDPAWQRLRLALDEVSGQRDCHVSRLFWYTDLEAAKAAARREHKAILSLRLLGKLTDEYSCANSRFFRTTLYSNQEISRVLQDRFILHWKSVRPVPKVTIDFGDGRKLERTLTGNSVHYVLDSEGRVIDALPGLYGPKPFLRELERAEQTAGQATTLPASQRERFLADYHRKRAAAIQAAWQADLETLGIPKVSSITEKKLLTQANFAGQMQALQDATSDQVWNRIAELHRQDCALDAASVALIRSEHPTAAQAARRAVTKMVAEDPLIRMVRTFQNSIALDTVRNEYLFHRQIHEWLAAGPTPDVDVLNERVYAQLFLTPSSDPWLGLMPPDTYTALEHGGVKQ